MNMLESIIGKKVFYSYKRIIIENYMNANDYYILSGNMEEYATMILDWSSHGYESEIDLFLLRPILQSLFFSSFSQLRLCAKKNLRDATLLYEAAYAKKKEDEEFTSLPLIHFCEFLLQTLTV